MLQVFACFESAKDLRACGFHMEIWHSSAKEHGLNPKSDLYLAQRIMAMVMWLAAVQIVRYRTLSHMHYMGCPPTCFVELLSTGDKLKTALGYCKTMWEAIQYMDKKEALIQRAGQGLGKHSMGQLGDHQRGAGHTFRIWVCLVSTSLGITSCEYFFFMGGKPCERTWLQGCTKTSQVVR